MICTVIQWNLLCCVLQFWYSTWLMLWNWYKK